MSKAAVSFLVLTTLFIGLYLFGRHPSPKPFDLPVDESAYENFTHVLPSGRGMTRAHALHFYELFLDILLNRHNRLENHAENVHLLNYILRNDAKWRVTETAFFNVLDVTGNEYINKLEFESFTNLFPRISDRRLIENFISVIDRNIDTKIMKFEWFNFCNKKLRPKLLQDLQKWESDTGHYLPNPHRIHAQFTALDYKERNHKDLIHGQLDRALKMMNEDFQMFIDHWENKTAHTLDDPDMFVRRMGYWILNRFERWDTLYMWIYQMLDDDGDGLLTAKEAADQFKVFEVPIVHVKELFSSLDDSNDGVLDRDEWADWSETLRRLLVLYFKEVEPKMADYE